MKNFNKTFAYYSISLILLILVMGFASGDLGTFKQGDCIQIKTILNATSVNISSISYPNSSIALTNVVMTKNLYTFNYSFCDTNTSGTYTYDYFDNEGNTYVNTFKVNPIGIESTGERSSAITRAIWIVFLLSLLFFISFFFTRALPIKSILIILCAIFIMAGLQLVSSTLNQEVVDPNIINLFDFISAAAYYFYWLGGGLILIVAILTLFSTIHDKYKNVKLGKYGGDENIGSKKY